MKSASARCCKNIVGCVPQRAAAAAVAAGGCSRAMPCSTAKRVASSTAASARQTRPRTPTRKRCSACSGCGRCSLAKPAGLRWEVRCSAAARHAVARGHSTRVMCNADDGDDEVLTHLGSSLADLDADDFVPSDGVRGPALALREQRDARADARYRRMRTRSSTTSSRASTTLAADSSRRSSGATARRPRTALRTLLRLRNPRKR